MDRVSHLPLGNGWRRILDQETITVGFLLTITIQVGQWHRVYLIPDLPGKVGSSPSFGRLLRKFGHPQLSTNELPYAAIGLRPENIIILGQ